MIALNPESRVEVTLPHYERMPEGERPVFVARFMTCREHQQVGRLFDEAVKQGGYGGVTQLVEVLRLMLVDWRHVVDAHGRQVPFDVEKLPDLLTWEEMWSLPIVVRQAITMSEADAKKSDEPSPTAGDAPANSATASDENSGGVQTATGTAGVAPSAKVSDR